MSGTPSVKVSLAETATEPPIVQSLEVVACGAVFRLRRIRQGNGELGPAADIHPAAVEPVGVLGWLLNDRVDGLQLADRKLDRRPQIDRIPVSVVRYERQARIGIITVRD